MAAQQFARLSCLIAFTKFVLTRVRTGVAARWTAERLRRGAAVAAAIDVTQGSIVCGVRPDRYEAVTMVRVTGRPYTLTLLRGSSRIVSTNVVPLEVLAGLLDQPGALHLAGIDVLNAGYRVRPRATGYPPLYATLLADGAAAGQRATYLIVRLDITESVAGLTYRASIGAAAAAASERIVEALLERNCRASALSAGSA